MNNVSAYPTYKQSGVQWLGDIPSHWEVKPLKYLCKIITGYTPPKNDESNYDNENGIIWVKPDNLDDLNIVTETKDKVSLSGLKNSAFIPKGSILVCSIGTIGKMGIAGKNLITNQQINSFIFNKNINNNFSKYMIFSAKNIFNHFANDNVVKILNSSTQKHISFVVPPLSEQTAIAEYLDRETAKIDAILAKQAVLLQTLHEQRTAIITNAVTKGLNPNVAMKNSGVAWLGDIPENWEVCRLKDLISCNDETLSDKTNLDYEMLYIDISNVSLDKGILKKEKMTFENSPSRARRIVKNGDVIISTVRTYLKSIAQIENAENNLIASTGFAVLRSKKDLSSKFLGYWVQSNFLIGNIVSNSVGVSYPAINSTDLIRLPILKIPLSEQTAIAEYLDHKTAQIDALCAKIEAINARLNEYRTALITNAVTGKIKVV